MNLRGNKPMKPMLLSLLTFVLVAVSAHAQVGVNALPVDGEDSLNVQQKIQEAQKEVLSRGPGFVLIGKVERGSSTPYSINGEDFRVDASTVVYGDLRLGVGAEVSGIIRSGNSKVAEVVTTAVAQESGASPPSPEDLDNH